jgi:glutaminase
MTHTASHEIASSSVPKSQDAGLSSAGLIDQREEQILRSLGYRKNHSICVNDFYRMLSSVGLRKDDERLRESIGSIEGYFSALHEAEDGSPIFDMPEHEFCKAIRKNILLVERALQGKLVIPEFRQFKLDIDEIFAIVREKRSGRVADYIPQLNLQEPEVDQFGLALCTVDGQRHLAGDAQTYFPIESACKPMSYCLALEEHGAQAVHNHIGQEPSGASFNELTLDKQNRPHNPMINAGAIMSCAFVRLTEKRHNFKNGVVTTVENRGWAGERFNFVMDRWQNACGGEKPRFSTEVYLSERSTADRNFALAYYMREKNAFPAEADLDDVLDFYFQCCSVEMTAESLSVFAATLANGGICPITGKRVFQTETVRKCLSLMLSCGMYDYSGEFAFSIGLPAKSGVSGVMMIVVPNVMGFCCWSPRLDECGNSVRGVEFCERLVQRFGFHNYDCVAGNSDWKDPRVSQLEFQANTVNKLIRAFSKGDLGAIEEQISRGANIGCQDYDLRTPLHLASAENQIGVVRYIIEQIQQGKVEVDINARDRWGGTPLDDAYLNGCTEIAEMLEAEGGKRGAITNLSVDRPSRPAHKNGGDSSLSGEMIWAASVGDLIAVRHLVARGVDLNSADYDSRTPLHLAAAEGHLSVVEFFISQHADVNPRDRWGNTPLDEAERHDKDDVVDYLSRNGGVSNSVGHDGSFKVVAN